MNLKTVLYQNSPHFHTRRRTIQRFCEKLGFVYFGTVDQHNDDHRVVRGLTVSASHTDTNYAIGAYEDYDVTVVDRFDTVVGKNQSIMHSQWLIFEVDLKIHKDAPHTFLLPKGHSHGLYDTLSEAFSHIQPVTLSENSHSEEFYNRYEIHAAPHHATEIEGILTPQITQSIAAHFWPLAVEIQNGNLYIYSTDKNISESLLESMLKNSTWLSQVLDKSVGEPVA